MEALAKALRAKKHQIDLHDKQARATKRRLDDTNKELEATSARMADSQKELEQLRSEQEKIVTETKRDDKKRKQLEHQQRTIAKKLRRQHKETDPRRKIDKWEHFVPLLLTWLLPPNGSYVHEPNMYHSGRCLQRLERFRVLRLVNKKYWKAVTQHDEQSISPLYVILQNDTWRFAHAMRVDIEDSWRLFDKLNRTYWDTTVTVYVDERRMQMGPIKRYEASFSLLIRLQDYSGYGVVCANPNGTVFMPYTQKKYLHCMPGCIHSSAVTANIAPELANCELAQTQLLNGKVLRIKFEDNKIRDLYLMRKLIKTAVTVELSLDVTLEQPVLHIKPALV